MTNTLSFEQIFQIGCGLWIMSMAVRLAASTRGR
jgi:hypothetical protein